MASPATDARSMLIDSGIGSGNVADDWFLSVSKMPDKPNRAIAIFDTGGTGEGPNPKWLLDYRTIQVRVRGGVNDYAVAFAKISNVKDRLLGMEATVQDSGDRWDGVTGIGDIAFLHRDENDRPELVMNFRIILEPADNAETQREPL